MRAIVVVCLCLAQLIVAVPRPRPVEQESVKDQPIGVVIKAAPRPIVDDLETSAQSPAPTLVRIRGNVGPPTQFIAPALFTPGVIPIPQASGVKGYSSPPSPSRAVKTKPAARPAPAPAPISQQVFEGGPGAEPEPYSFGFDVRDEYGNSQYRKEEGDTRGVVRGSYGYTDAAGVYRQVEYVADANGFRANVKTNEPGMGSAAPAAVELLAVEPPSGLYGTKPARIRAEKLRASNQAEAESVQFKTSASIKRSGNLLLPPGASSRPSQVEPAQYPSGNPLDLVRALSSSGTTGSAIRVSHSVSSSSSSSSASSASSSSSQTASASAVKV